MQRCYHLTFGETIFYGLDQQQSRFNKKTGTKNHLQSRFKSATRLCDLQSWFHLCQTCQDAWDLQSWLISPIRTIYLSPTSYLGMLSHVLISLETERPTSLSLDLYMFARSPSILFLFTHSLTLSLYLSSRGWPREVVAGRGRWWLGGRSGVAGRSVGGVRWRLPPSARSAEGGGRGEARR